MEVSAFWRLALFQTACAACPLSQGGREEMAQAEERE